MKLRYHLSRNFGDALNPLIFHHFLPDFFDDNEDVEFIGIGSILGFKTVKQARRKIIFSTGYAYGGIPTLDSTYDFRCVRGPLTCQALSLDPTYAIADGAILLQYMPNDETSTSPLQEVVFMPHWESALKFDWKTICDAAGIGYLDPVAPIQQNLRAIREAKLVIAEAMHAAIVADTLRVPWLPVYAYGGINTFKWQDWAASLNLPYEPQKITPLYHNTSFTRRVIKEKTGYPFSRKSLSPLVKTYLPLQRLLLVDSVVDLFTQMKRRTGYLSNNDLLKEKGEQLLEKLDAIRRDYGGAH